MSTSGFPANKFTVARNTGRNLRNTKLEEVKLMIQGCAMLAGFGRDFEELEINVLVQQLIENKGYFKVAEVKAAFDCAFNGELEIKPEDLKPYNQFSWLYLSRILTAYEKKVQNGKLIQDISEPTEEKAATNEEIIDSKLYVVNQIIEQFTRGEDHDFGPIGNTDANIVNLVFKTLKEFGYSLGEPKELRELYIQERKKELNRAEHWRRQKKRGEFAEYKSSAFMSKNKEAMNRNPVHREVAKRCRLLSVAKFYEEQKEFELDLVSELKERFEDWKSKLQAS